MTIKNFFRLRLPGRPDRNVRIRASRYDASILEIGDGIHRAIMKAKNLLGSVAG